MRKLLFIAFASLTLPAIAQQPTKKTYNLSERAADHIVLQMSSDHWTGVPDSISSHIGSLSRGGNIYLMLDKPFKGNQQLSVGIGLGVGTSNIYFKKMQVDIASKTLLLPFRATDTGTNFKKYKLATSFVEVPLELRFSSNPETPNKSVKAAIGIKGGLLINAHTKGKTLRSASGSTINQYTEKILTKSYFNTTRFAATARVGYGIFNVFGAYNLTSIFKDGVSADMRLFQVGLMISGL